MNQMKEQRFLRHLVDCVWNHVTESTEVPSTQTANMLIANARISFEEENKKGLDKLVNRLVSENVKLKEEQLKQYTKNSIFEEYYSHSGCDMYKILNEHTKYREDKWVLSPVSEGKLKALDLAILEFSKLLL